MSKAADARDYLADDLDEEAEDHVATDGEAYEALAGYLRHLPATDPLCSRLATALEPFLVDDDRLDGTLYPGGEGMRHMTERVPPCEPDGQ